MPVLQKSHKFRVRVWGFYRPYTSSGHWHGSVTEFTEVLRVATRAYRTHRSSGYGYERRAELTEVPGTGMNVLQGLKKFFVIPG